MVIGFVLTNVSDATWLSFLPVSFWPVTNQPPPRTPPVNAPPVLWPETAYWLLVGPVVWIVPVVGLKNEGQLMTNVPLSLFARVVALPVSEALKVPVPERVMPSPLHPLSVPVMDSRTTLTFLCSAGVESLDERQVLRLAEVYSRHRPCVTSGTPAGASLRPFEHHCAEAASS